MHRHNDPAGEIRFVFLSAPRPVSIVLNKGASVTVGRLYIYSPSLAAENRLSQFGIPFLPRPLSIYNSTTFAVPSPLQSCLLPLSPSCLPLPPSFNFLPPSTSSLLPPPFLFSWTQSTMEQSRKADGVSQGQDPLLAQGSYTLGQIDFAAASTMAG